jgi:prepilin-type N-terminal cleavage/methylation domain-containing protein
MGDLERVLEKAKKSAAQQAGFSLVEITIVVLIATVLMAFAIPMIGNAIRAYNLKSAGDHLAERIAAVRALAIAKNRNVTFSFNNGSGKYGFDFTGTEGDGVPDTTDPDATEIAYHTENLPSGITATFPGSNPIKVTFNSRGELPIGSTDRSIVISNGSRSLTVAVNLRGRIYVQ